MRINFIRFIVITLVIALTNFKKSSAQTVFTSDIDNFWIAYDSIKTTNDSAQQINFINKLYINKGTEGLKAFMKARDYSAPLWVELINRYPKFWNSIRPNTQQVKLHVDKIEASIIKLKQLYPFLKPARMYFTVGCMNSGGTTSDNMVLIGAEITTGDTTTDVSELPVKWLAGVFKVQTLSNIVNLNIHEYVHTQQDGSPSDLLGQCIKEGACDFITELVAGKPIRTNYINYGRLHETELKAQFKQHMFTSNYNTRYWLYNGLTKKSVPDLGYFMGYAICSTYYHHAANLIKAIKEIIQLDYSNSVATTHFLKKSKYYPEPLKKQILLADYRAKMPTITAIEPFKNGDTLVDTSIKEVRFVFSEEMDTGRPSIDATTMQYTFKEVIGFSTDAKSFSIKCSLKPNTAYSFVILVEGLCQPKAIGSRIIQLDLKRSK